MLCVLSFYIIGGTKPWDTWLNLRIATKKEGKAEVGSVRVVVTYTPNNAEQSGDASGGSKKSKNEILDVAKDVRDTLIRNIEERDKKIENVNFYVVL